MLLKLIDPGLFGFNFDVKAFTVVFRKVRGRLTVATTPSVDRPDLAQIEQSVPAWVRRELEEGVAYTATVNLDALTAPVVLRRFGEPVSTEATRWLSTMVRGFAIVVATHYQQVLNLLRKQEAFERAIADASRLDLRRKAVAGRMPMPGERTVVLVCDDCRNDPFGLGANPRELRIRIPGFHHGSVFFDLVASMVKQAGEQVLRRVEREQMLEITDEMISVIALLSILERLGSMLGGRPRGAPSHFRGEFDFSDLDRSGSMRGFGGREWREETGFDDGVGDDILDAYLRSRPKPGAPEYLFFIDPLDGTPPQIPEGFAVFRITVGPDDPTR